MFTVRDEICLLLPLYIPYVVDQRAPGFIKLLAVDTDYHLFSLVNKVPFGVKHQLQQYVLLYFRAYTPIGLASMSVFKSLKPLATSWHSHYPITL